MKKTLLLLPVILAAALPMASGQPGPGWGTARWVWDQPDANSVAQTDDLRYLRRTFDLTGAPTKADLWITADNEYTVYVNGQKVGAGKAWEQLDKYDVTKHLVQGKNVLAIRAQNHGGPAGVIARLQVATANKKSVLTVGTDEQTRITQIANPDWLKNDFDDKGWPTAVVLGDASIGPWNLAAGKAAPAGGGFQFQVADPKINKQQKAEDQLKNFIVPEGFEVELVAADPLVINPVTMAVDEKGRIYVSESHTYRYGPPGSPIKPFSNPLVRLDPIEGGKGYKRVPVADGFDDPVMGIAVKGDKLWVTANNYLYTYYTSDLPDKPATNKKTIVNDKNKAWNPFGMFVLEFGPDGMLYMSVGNHGMELIGPEDQKVNSRGGSGIIVRMKPDGTDMQPLVQGLRVPYSFEYDPFGQLWVLSNGEGNPDRFVRVIEGAVPVVVDEKGKLNPRKPAQIAGPPCVDYHCYSRGVDNGWLAGNSPLAPPCFELHRGAHTQLLRYYASAFPLSYQGSLLACNWGSHGFPGLNRGIFRYIPDERNNIVKKEPFVMCSDPYFRPSHIHLDPDGNLLIADWYGRDDESDLTGRIWRVKYTGKEAKPVVKHKLETDEWNSDAYAMSALSSPHHLIRAKAIERLSHKKKAGFVETIGYQENPLPADPLGAANALWLTYRHRGSRAFANANMNHPDWRVRRLAVNLLGRYGFINSQEFNKDNGAIAREKDPAVALELAIALPNNQHTKLEEVRSAFMMALKKGAAADPHLRYSAAWHLAQYADEATLSALLTDADENMNLTGLIAIDVACWEKLPTKKDALAALGKALITPSKLDLALALQVAQLNGDASLAPALEKLVARQDVPLGVVAKGLTVLKSKTGSYGKAIEAGAAKRFVEAVEKGAIKVTTPADQLLLFEFLDMEGPSPFALKQIEGQLHSGNKEVHLAAHTLARRFGAKAAPLTDPLWPSVLNPKTKFDVAIDDLSTIARIQGSPDKSKWWKLLEHTDADLRMEALRWFRHLPGKIRFEVDDPKGLLAKDPRIADDLGMLAQMWAPIEGLKLPGPEKDKDALTKYVLKELAAIPAAERPKRAAMGLQVFERNACTKCHTTATQTTPLAPSLKGIAAQKADYLVESVLYPSKVIKTGFETELIVTKSGQTLSGLVKEEGNFLRVLNLDKDTKIAKADIEERRLQKVSIMPEGQELEMSRREFVDLMAYLQTLK